MALVADGASSSSPSIQTQRWSNHVFLSFRGEDTRKGFTDHLFASLERRGVKTFKDDHDLERGGVIPLELIKAIEVSMFAIIILSPNYASSTWCLYELQAVVECSNTFGQGVFPVFYGVDPCDVRHQRGAFGEAFRIQEERFREEKWKVQIWRDALIQVASLSGWVSKDRHEAALVETIVDHIQKIFIPKLPSCTDNLVGVDSWMKEVNSLIGMRLDDVRFIGIWGMGGVGKTTIARLVYEAIKEEFQVSCFLANIREMSETNGLVHIQRELLSYLNIRSGGFYTLFDGKKIISNSLCNKKVLLVLDDVSDLSQLENLAEKQEWFGPGSRVIITTRDKHLLMTHGVHKTCEFRGLIRNEALHLFCLKAFKRDQPEEGYLDLCEEVVEYTKGLPLALEVFGSHLYGRTIEVWHSALKQIRSFPHPKIQNALKISYDGLHSSEKDMFLDIACFFKGMDRDEVIDILEKCGHCPRIGIEILIERSLVTLDRVKNKLGMHDLLQEMGRSIVFQESPNDPSRRSRLWSQDDIDHVLTKNKGTEAIQGIVLDSVHSYEACWSVEAFSNTSQLRLLKLCEMHLPLGLKCLPCALRVLQWKGCPLKTLPVTNQMDEVIDINLCHSKVEQLWHGTKILEKLKSINLSFSKNLKQSPDFVGVPNLESLVLEGCTSLTELHPSLVRHKKLVLLNLKDCKGLKAFPNKMEMSSLKDLNLSGCSALNTAPEFGESMEHLSVLSLEGTAITKLPPSLGCLVGLDHLKLKNCKNLVCLPDTIHRLESLRFLNVSGCSKLLSLPKGLKKIKCLEELCASDTAIEELPSCVLYLENLRVMSFAGCKGPISAPSANMFLPFKWLFGSQQAATGFSLPHSIPCLPFLSTIDLSYCNLSDESMPDDFFRLSSLRSLDLTGNNFVSLPRNISKLAKLEYLCLNRSRKLQLLPQLPLSIRELDASNCSSLLTCSFNPSNPFASPVQWRFIEGLGFPTTRFDMLITGSAIPSWFSLQNSSGRYRPYTGFALQKGPYTCPETGFARRLDPRPYTTGFDNLATIEVTGTSCLETELVGFALCVKLTSFADRPRPRPREVCHHEIECHFYGRKGKGFTHSRILPLMLPRESHLYILFISIDEYQARTYEGDECSRIKFHLTICPCQSLEIVRYGCRFVCKKDIPDMYASASPTGLAGMIQKYRPGSRNMKKNKIKMNGLI